MWYVENKHSHLRRRLQSLRIIGGTRQKVSDNMYYSEVDFRDILKEYPAVVTKEQFYKLCHISKRVASYYLEQGFLPCEKRKGKTHKYLIKTKDIVTFIRARQSDPMAYQAPTGISRQPVNADSAKINNRNYISTLELSLWRTFLTEVLADFPDVCNVREVVLMCGYSKETVLKWCEAEKFVVFNIRRTYHIPKKSFIEFMGSAEFDTIPQKQEKHIELLNRFDVWKQQP